MKNKILVLGNQVSHLHTLRDLVGVGDVVSGTTNKKKREAMFESFRNGDLQVIYATYALASEGLDLPMMTDLVLAAPIKNRSRVLQSVGRVERSYPGKKVGRVHDFVDACSSRAVQSIFDKSLTERKRLYRSKGYKIKEVK